MENNHAAHAEKLKRRPHKKTRTGCQTCRIRRVKCDERKPKCKRCENFGVECDGYPQPKPNVPPKKPLPPCILPRTGAERGNVTILQAVPAPKWKIPRHSHTTREKELPENWTSCLDANTDQQVSNCGSQSSNHLDNRRAGKINVNARHPSSRLDLFDDGIDRSRPLQQMLASSSNHSLSSSDSYFSRCYQPSLLLFRDEQEYQYFRFFSDKTAVHLAENYAPTLWKYLIFQASELEPSIFHTVVALGALDASVQRSRSCIKPINRIRQYSEDEHYRFSLQQYSTAIKQMREGVADGKYDLRTSLISSILIITFETYYGNHELALSQIGSSVKLLENWIRNQESNIQRPSSPIPSLVEDELVQAFDRFEVEAMIFKDNTLIEQHMFRKDDRSAAIENMPKQFSSVEEASAFGKLLQRRAWHFLCIAWSYDDQAPRPDIHMNLYDRIKANPTPQACAERDKYRKEVERFHLAVAPLLERADRIKDKEGSIASRCMRIFFNGLRIGLDNCFEKDETSYDKFLPVFLEILSAAKSVLKVDGEAYFIPNTQVLLGLGVISQKCRDSSIRREAIQLIRSMERREVFCDSGTLAEICEWIVGVEEEGMMDGYVPEESRTRGVIIFRDPERQGMYVSCKLPKKGGEAGEMVTRETFIKW